MPQQLEMMVHECNVTSEMHLNLCRSAPLIFHFGGLWFEKNIF